MLRRMRKCLWATNAVLSAGILLYAIRFLLFPTLLDRLAGIRAVDLQSSTSVREPAGAAESVFTAVSNPVHSSTTSVIRLPFRMFALTGAIPAQPPRKGVAFLRAMSRPVDLTARMGEEILQDGRPAPEFGGWCLSDLWKDRAVFTHPSGERVELQIDQGGGPEESASARTEEPYRKESYKSRMLAASEGREVWGIDPAEAEWAVRNATRMLDQDGRIVPYAGGGLRIEQLSPGSMAASRGLKNGDVLREINGRPILSLGDLQSPGSGPTLRLTLDRAGKPFVLEFHPLPR